MKHLLIPAILLFLLLLTSPLSAQPLEAYDTIGDNLLFRKELTGSAIIHTNGWGLEFRKGTNRSIFTKLMWEVNLLEMKDAKEIKSINQFFTNTKSYFYGKLNAVYMLRTGIGRQHMLNRKPYSGGVEVRLFYSGGVNAGFTKPVYLNILKPDKVAYRYVIVTERYDPEEHFPDNIYGRANFFKGFNQLSFYPGAYLKVGLNVDFGTINQRPKTFEVGAVLDGFPKAIPAMAFRSPNNLFLTLYLSFGIGKRYD
ncbi:MAG: hypothetical protein RBR28_09550 [Lentimicrobium sp.]|jgi:hypothetical protein|nr:hypothetical protein [Lentimicrobium sp.]